MKKSIFLLCYFCFSLSLLAQPTINGEWTETVNETFSELEKERIPTGILLDYAMEFADVTAYNGAMTDTTSINLRVFSNIYKTLFMGRVTTDTVFFPQMKTVAQNWALQRLEQNGEEQRTIVLGGLFYEYARIDPDALEENRITVTENGYADNYIENVWQNPYITQSTMAFAPPIHSYNRLEFDVLLPGELFLTNIPDATEAIEVDFGDGNGYQSISFGEVKRVQYDEEGIYNWRFKLALESGQERYAHTYLRLQAYAPTSPDQCMEGPVSITAAEQYLGIAGSATLQIRNSGCDGIRKPLIVAVVSSFNNINHLKESHRVYLNKLL